MERRKYILLVLHIASVSFSNVAPEPMSDDSKTLREGTYARSGNTFQIRPFSKKCKILFSILEKFFDCYLRTFCKHLGMCLCAKKEGLLSLY